MKNKTKIREQRQQQKQQARQQHQQKEAVRNEERRKAKEAEEKEKEAKRMAELLRNTDLHPVRTRILSETKKSTAKAAGLKSTFIMGDQDLLMTSFGKGNKAIVEKKIKNGVIKDVAEQPAFTARKDEKREELYFQIDGRVKNASTDNPLYHASEKVNTRDDLIHARSALEKLYYGENFQDNIHIQAIYSILDIEKILSVHINNIVYMLNNFLRGEGNDMVDLVGNLFGNVSYEKFQNPTEKNQWKLDAFKKLRSARQLGYLNLQVLPKNPPKDKNGKPVKIKKDPNAVQITDEDFYYMLVAVSEMRNMLAHGNPKQNIYKMGNFGEKNAIAPVLDKLYADKVKELNAHFLDRAGKNLVLLFRAYGIKEKEQKARYVKDYYDFTVRKTYKNTGFSIKLLREHMTEEIPDAVVLRDKKYDSVRGKLYPFVDFAIYRYYMDHPEEAENLVGALRASFSEKSKDDVYSTEAKRIWPDRKVSDLILNHILPEMSGDLIKELIPDPDVSADMLKGVLVTEEATTFSKMIYMLTMFINGKEINDLLTTLIHQFENIEAFTAVMKKLGVKADFKKDFELFDYSGQVSSELRTINSFARMAKEAANAKEAMFIEAFHVLGIRADEETLEREVKDILDPEKSGNGSQKRGVRNFIANNVIESVRFKYLVRYGNVKKLKGIAQNAAVIAFVLKDIPDDQIRRYYVDAGENGITDVNAMRQALTDRLTGFSFEDLRDVRQSDREANREEQEEKKQKQALVRLYLTVLYLALKNLVNINSRYFLAFHCVERDRLLLNPEYWKEAAKPENSNNPVYGYSVFACDFLKQYPRKPRVAKYLDQNFGNSDEWAIRAYRNKVEHLDAIRNAELYLGDVKEIHSWYGLYHYILQRRLMDQFAYDSTHGSRKNEGQMIVSREELNPKTLEYFKMVETYGTYCKDFVKALNVPFAYNLPRYKNLSIDELFDQNRPGAKGSGKLSEE